MKIKKPPGAGIKKIKIWNNSSYDSIQIKTQICYFYFLFACIENTFIIILFTDQFSLNFFERDTIISKTFNYF